jgi:chromosome segregation ATPase
LKEEEKQYTGRKSDANELTKELERTIIDKRHQLDEATFENRSMVNIVHRIKHDKVVYDQRKFNFEKELEFLKKKLNIVKREEHSVGENADRAKKVFEKLASQLKTESRERIEHLANLQSSIQTRVELKEMTSTREIEIHEIAERAMQDKDENEKNWKKLLSVHKFVSMVLREKMEREMSKFKVVEVAFKNIKIATGTADTVELVNKFLNKETVYGELLSKIADSEKKIDTLKHEHEDLERQCRKIQEEMDLFEITKKGNPDLSSNYKLMQRNSSSWIAMKKKGRDRSC